MYSICVPVYQNGSQILAICVHSRACIIHLHIYVCMMIVKNMQQYNMICLRYSGALAYYLLLCFKAAYHRDDTGEINCLNKDARCSLEVLM